MDDQDLQHFEQSSHRANSALSAWFGARIDYVQANYYRISDDWCFENTIPALSNAESCSPLRPVIPGNRQHVHPHRQAPAFYSPRFRNCS